MSAYVIFAVRASRDEAALRVYREAARPTIGAFGGRAIVARGRSTPLEGNPPAETVVLEFPDVPAAQAWYHSEAYQSALQLRRGAADVEAQIVEGVAPAAGHKAA